MVEGLDGTPLHLCGMGGLQGAPGWVPVPIACRPTLTDACGPMMCPQTTVVRHREAHRDRAALYPRARRQVRCPPKKNTKKSAAQIGVCCILLLSQCVTASGGAAICGARGGRRCGNRVWSKAAGS